MRLLVLGLLLAAVLCGASLTNTAFEPIYTAVCTLSSTKSSGATAGEGFPVHPAAVPLEHWCCNRWNVTATVFAVRPPGRLQPVHLTKGLKPMFCGAAPWIAGHADWDQKGDGLDPPPQEECPHCVPASGKPLGHKGRQAVDRRGACAVCRSPWVPPRRCHAHKDRLTLLHRPRPPPPPSVVVCSPAAANVVCSPAGSGLGQFAASDLLHLSMSLVRFVGAAVRWLVRLRAPCLAGRGDPARPVTPAASRWPATRRGAPLWGFAASRRTAPAVGSLRQPAAARPCPRPAVRRPVCSGVDEAGRGEAGESATPGVASSRAAPAAGLLRTPAAGRPCPRPAVRGGSSPARAAAAPAAAAVVWSTARARVAILIGPAAGTAGRGRPPPSKAAHNALTRRAGRIRRHAPRAGGSDGAAPPAVECGPTHCF